MRLILKILGIMVLTSLPTTLINACTTKIPTPPSPIPPTFNVAIEKIVKISFWPVSGYKNTKAIRFEQSDVVNVTGVTDSTFWNPSFGLFFYGVISNNPSLVAQIEKKLHIQINKQIINLPVSISNIALLYDNKIFTHEIRDFRFF